MDITDILAALFGHGGQQGAPSAAAGFPSQVGDHANPAALQAAMAQFAPQGQAAQQQQPMPAPASVQQPMQPRQQPIAAQAPQGQSVAQDAQMAPTGGGVGDFLSNLFTPKTASKNRTVGWLQQQGLDQGTATLIASDPSTLRNYLVQRSKSGGPTEFDQRGEAAKQYGLDPSTPEGRRFILTGQMPTDAAEKTPSFGPVGQDAYGNPTYGWRDPTTLKITPVNSPDAAGGGAYSNADVAQLHGNDFIQTLPPALASQVQAYASGRMQMPSGYALKSPYFQKMMQMVTQYDPTFDAVDYNARAKTRADFTSGKSAQSINGINTVIGHLDSLNTAADALGNSSYPMWNAAKNAYENATGSPQIKTFDTTKKAVVDELTRVWRGSGGSEGDIKTWSDQINAANSPDQLHAVIGQVGDLLESKINALGETYHQGMGITADPIEFVTKKSQAVLDRLRGNTTPPPQQGDIYAPVSPAAAATMPAQPPANPGPGDPAAATPGGQRVIQQMTNPAPIVDWKDYFKKKAP